MLEWDSPLFFLANALVPLVFYWTWTRRPKVRFSSLSLITAKPTIRVWTFWLPELLIGVGLVLAIIALARPQKTNTETIVESSGIDIMLALDVSGSMEQADYKISGRNVSRLNVAKAVMDTFVEERPADRIGLVVFGEEAITQVPLTLDHLGLSEFLTQVQIGMAGKRRTAVGDAIAIASQRLEKLEAPTKVVILVTDGQSNAGQIQPIDAAKAAAALGIKVYTIGVGADPSSIMEMLGATNDLDEDTLTQIAEITNAKYFRAGDTQTLKKVYDSINQLEVSEAKVKIWVDRDELYRKLLLPGIMFLFFGFILSSTVYRRLP